jgi:hypothetical protein
MSTDSRGKRLVNPELWGDLMGIIRMQGYLSEGKNHLGVHSIFDGSGYYSAEIRVTVVGGDIRDIYIYPQVDNPQGAHHHLFVDSQSGEWMMMYASSKTDWR